jgi:hypothetical protein
MNLLMKSIRWTQSCPRTGGGLYADARIALYDKYKNVVRQFSLIIVICHSRPPALF